MSCDGCKYFMMCVRRYHKSGRQQKCENFEPDQPHGEWKKVTMYESFCSNCNNAIDRQYFTDEPPFCPNCGADMREGDEK